MTQWGGPLRLFGPGASRRVSDCLYGVYLICWRVKSSTQVVYVGQGAPIGSRIRAHRGGSRDNERLRRFLENHPLEAVYYFAPVLNRDDRNDLEYTLFTYYGGWSDLLCNVTPPPGDYDPSILSLPYPSPTIADSAPWRDWVPSGSIVKRPPVPRPGSVSWRPTWTDWKRRQGSSLSCRVPANLPRNWKIRSNVRRG